MKIIHVCLSCFYIDNYRYQENELVRQHVKNGHDVLVIASTETYIDNMNLGYVDPGQYIGSDGAKVIRLAYTGYFPFLLKKKVRKHREFYGLLQAEEPDIIMFHGLCGWELLNATKYKRNHPHVKLYVDSHEDFNNSASSFLSRIFLHRGYYRRIVQCCIDAIDKVLCVSLDTLHFCRDFYQIPVEKLEFYPLGGEILDDSSYVKARAEARKTLGINSTNTVFIQSGKFDKLKRLDYSLKAFFGTKNEFFRFFVIGNLAEEIQMEARSLIAADPRVTYIGWKTSDELYSLLCAADVYIQPGSQSATLQMSLCARCPVVLADVPSHEPFINGNGWKVTGYTSLCEVFNEIDANPAKLHVMANKSFELSSKILDYEVLAKRLLI